MTYRSLELTEKQWQDQVLEVAHMLGWYCHHDHDSRKQDWRADSGFPDLVLAKDGRIIFAELKTAKGRMTPMQQGWRRHLGGDALIGPPEGVEVYLWRPDDWPEVERILKGEA